MRVNIRPLLDKIGRLEETLSESRVNLTNLQVELAQAEYARESRELFLTMEESARLAAADEKIIDPTTGRSNVSYSNKYMQSLYMGDDVWTKHDARVRELTAQVMRQQTNVQMYEAKMGNLQKRLALVQTVLPKLLEADAVTPDNLLSVLEDLVDNEDSIS